MFKACYFNILSIYLSSSALYDAYQNCTEQYLLECSPDVHANLSFSDVFDIDKDECDKLPEPGKSENHQVVLSHLIITEQHNMYNINVYT